MRKVLSLFLVVILGLFACDKEIKSNIPRVSFRFEASLLADPYSKLRIPGEFFTVDKNNYGVTLGYAGIILGQSIWDVTYFAYDRACQVEASRNVKLEIVDDKETGFKVAKCPECETRYLLNNNGVPIDGDGIPALQHYYISVIGDNVIIYN